MQKWTATLLVLLGCVALGACDDGGDGDDDQCVYEGMTYQIGDEFPAGDNCNTCSCVDQGDGTAVTECSLVSCSDAGTPDADVSDASPPDANLMSDAQP